MVYSDFVYCTDFKKISAAVLAVFCCPAMARNIRTTLDVFTPINQVISNQTYKNENIDLFGTGDHLTLSNGSITYVYKNGELDNSHLLGDARLNILSGANADQITVDGQSIMYGVGGSINNVSIKNDGMLEVFQNSQVNGTILNSFPSPTRWSMRLYKGGFAKNTIINHGFLIEEKGHLYNTIANNKPCKKHQYTIKAYGGDIVNTTLNNGSKLLVQATHQEGVSNLNGLTINDKSEADLLGLADLQAKGDHITVNQGGRLNLGQDVKISNTYIHQGASLSLAQNDELAGKTILSGNLSLSPNFNRLKTSGDLVLNKNHLLIANFPIIGSGNLSQIGSGAVILNSKNQYSGSTSVGNTGQPDQISQLEVNGALVSPMVVLSNGLL